MATEQAEAAEYPLRLEWRTPEELTDNPRNWRKHPPAQTAALNGVLAEVGWAGACLYNERTGRLIDGHARKKVPRERLVDGRLPVLVGSWSEEDEAKILATLDPLAAMAKTDREQLDSLIGGVETSDQAVQAMLDGLSSADAALMGGGDVAELEISPELFERSDYLVIVFDSEFDWNVACEKLGVRTVTADPSGGSTIQHKGLGRVVKASKLLEVLGCG